MQQPLRVQFPLRAQFPARTGFFARSRFFTRAQHGFTLLEILVVVVIIAILTALLLPNLSSGGRWRDLQREAGTLALRIRVAQDDAMLYGREYGIVFSENGYRFVAWDAEASRFRAVEPEERWMLREFDDDIRMLASVSTNDPILVMPEAKDEPAEETTAESAQLAPAEMEPVYEPSVYVLSSGEVTPFTAEFSAESEDAPVALQIDALGNRVEDDAAGNADAP